jgi:hypothetical protein
MKTMNSINDKLERKCDMLYKNFNIEIEVLIRKQRRDTRYIKNQTDT